jgi:protease I
MARPLEGKKIAILATNGVEQVEMTEPWRAVEEAGGTVELVSTATGRIQAWHGDEKGDSFPVDRDVGDVTAGEYDGLIVPGGTKSPDRLRTNAEAVALVRRFFEEGKPIASICHGPWLLVEAGVVRGLTLTSWPSLRTDIENAGGRWVDAEVQTDRGVVTSRKPDDLPAFCAKLVEELAEGRHERRVPIGAAGGSARAG